MEASERTAGRVRMIVELDRETEPPSGSIQSEHGERYEFTSLLELIALIESARSWPHPST